MLMVLESLGGVLYMAVLIALLVALYSRPKADGSEDRLKATT